MLKDQSTARSGSNQRAEIIERDEMCCGICGGRVADPADIEIDHILPISRGGLTVASNLQVAHGSCNRAKGVQVVSK